MLPTFNRPASRPDPIEVERREFRRDFDRNDHARRINGLKSPSPKRVWGNPSGAKYSASDSSRSRKGLLLRGGIG
jgi:hypothetical protein